jgi:hypothetical protein
MISWFWFVLTLLLFTWFPWLDGHRHPRTSEFLSKVAIVVTAWSTWALGGWSTTTALIVAAVALVVSVLRDANLKMRGIKRMAPPFGIFWVWNMIAWHSLVGSLNWVLYQTGDTRGFLEPTAITAGAGWCALFLDLVCIVIEAVTNRTFNRVLGWDEGQFTRIMDQLENPQPPPVQVVEIQCPRCGNHNPWGTAVCQHCGYGGQPPSSNRSRPRLPGR